MILRSVHREEGTADDRSKKERQAGLCLILLLSALALAIALPLTTRVLASPQQSTTITLSPSNATIDGCETIGVEIWINNVNDLYGADVRLSFDPTIVEGIDIVPGDFLTNTWTTLDSIDNSAGTIEYAVTQLNPQPPADGSGVLATIQLRAAGEGVSDLAFTYTQLATRNGVEIPATSEDGDVTTSPPASPSLSISRVDDTTARLSWTAAAGVADYDLYRDSAPYFTPSGSPYHTTTSISYDDVGALGDTGTNHYYVVRSACENGFQSANSNRVGEYDYGLASDSSSNYNDVALVLDVPSVNDAASLAAYVGSSVKRVLAYDAATQSFRSHTVGFPQTNFNLSIGEFAFLITDSSAPPSVALVGGVPDPGAVSFTLVSGSPAKYNYLSLPLDQDHLSSASDVAADIGPSTVKVLKYLSPDQQTYRSYTPGFPSTDFPLVIGEPFAVVLSSGAPSQWP